MVNNMILKLHQPPPRRGPMADLKRKALKVALVVALVWVAWWAVGQLIALYPEYLWFESMGFQQVFMTELESKVALGVSVFFLTVAWLAGNAYLAERRAPGRFVSIKGIPIEITRPIVKKLLRLAFGVVLVLVAFELADDAAGQWFQVQQCLHARSFQRPDPILGYDAGFYVFTLPVLAAVKNYILTMGILGLIVSVVAYFFGGAIASPFGAVTRPAALHLGLLAALVFAAAGFGYWLDRFSLLSSSRGFVFGVGYVDDKIRLPLYWVMMAICLASVVLVLVGALRLRLKPIFWSVGLLVGGHLVLIGGFPAGMQQFEVLPNELQVERPYIANNLDATQFAYGLKNVEVREFPAASGLTLQDLHAVAGTYDNIRLWDWRVLEATYTQLQALRPYYRFPHVDVDRYQVEGKYRQVHVAARELEESRLPGPSQTWVNFHLVYTHGYGLVMSPVNAVTVRGGLPQMWMDNIPVKTTVPIDLKRAGIYFGEMTDDYIFVRTSQDEFDYPTQAGSSATQYDGKSGVPLNSLGRRVLMALYFGDWNILLTGSFGDETRVLWRRNIRKMVRRIAPFLKYDKDAYPVIDQGRMVWILDAYTTADRFPYSTAAARDEGLPLYPGAEINYIRNSVKVAIDAYDGSPTFYVADPNDPLIRTARGIFPTLFRDLADMPPSLRAHVRYPPDLFDIQAGLFRAYHVTDPEVFYNNVDLWQRPNESYGQMVHPVASYYMIMTLPEETQPEYVLMLPFTPNGKNNMAGWMAGRCDGEHYGKLLVYRFPRDRTILGPIQVEASIDQDQTISPQLSLWNQHGSRVVRGNLMVIPVRDAILYVEPLYLKSEKAEFPELTRVIAVYGDRVAMCDTLDEALAAVLAGGAARPEKPGPEEKPTPAATPGLKALAERARALFDKAQAQSRAGDWAAYGESLKELGKVLEEMTGPSGAPKP